jgi:tetratricopeptide (TPR) repeat protein
MATAERFTRREFQRLLDITEKQLAYWEKLRIVLPRERGSDSYDFRDLIGARTAKQLIDSGIPAKRLRKSLDALQAKLDEVQAPLTELRILSNGRDVLVERGGQRLEPISGQFILNFETRELRDRVRVMPERNAEAWFALALEHEANPETRPQAVEAYERVLRINPDHVQALLNLGTLHYESAALEQARDCFERAARLAPENDAGHFNLGSLLDEIGELERARVHLRLAVRLNPQHADAHYNLAFVCEKLAARAEARQHWKKYLELDPASSWSNYAREQLRSEPKKHNA